MNATLSSLTALIALSAHCWEAAKASSSNLLSWERWVLASLMSFLVAVSVSWDHFSIYSRHFVKLDCIEDIFVFISVFSSETAVPRVSVSLGFCCWGWLFCAFFLEGCPPTQAGKLVSYTIWGEHLFIQAFFLYIGGVCVIWVHLVFGVVSCKASGESCRFNVACTFDVFTITSHGYIVILFVKAIEEDVDTGFCFFKFVFGCEEEKTAFGFGLCGQFNAREIGTSVVVFDC
jgi:hypothetical protein